MEKNTLKLRLKSWWWGRYIEKKNGRWYDATGNIFPQDEYDKATFVPYIEEIDGLEAGRKHMDPWEIKRFLDK